MKLKLTKPQKEVITGLKNGRKMTFAHYIGDTNRATWDDEPWTPYQKNWSVVVRALRKKGLVEPGPSDRTFHVWSVVLTEAGKKEVEQ